MRLHQTLVQIIAVMFAVMFRCLFGASINVPRLVGHVDSKQKTSGEGGHNVGDYLLYFAHR